jgi:predicted membrane protein
MADDPKSQDPFQEAAAHARQAAARAQDAVTQATRYVRSRPFADNVQQLVAFQKIVQLVVGLFVVFAGVLFTLDNLHILHAREYLRFWPLAFVMIGILQMARWRTTARFLAGGLWILLGVTLLLRVNVFAFWPLVLVAVGGRVMWRAFSTTRDKVHAGGFNSGMTIDNESVISSTAVLGGFGRRIVAQEFQRGEFTAFMGGGKVDLREAKLAGGEAVLDLFVIMGGFELLVPDTWSVIVELTPFMGGYDDKTRQNAPALAPRLIIRGFVMMGGIEIKN